MLQQVTTVGPLASASATQISLSQKAAGAQFLVLNGAAGSFTANNICTSQTPSGAGNLTLNGTLASGSPAVAYTQGPTYIYITTAADESGVTFTITGRGVGPGQNQFFGVTETITGANNSIVSSANQYWSISQIAVSGATTGAITVGTYTTATLDVARQILFTPAGSDSGITYAITGGDGNGNSISETVTGVNNPSTATSALSYLTIKSIKVSGAVASTMTVGTNGVAHSPWVSFDPLAGMSTVSIQVNGTGTVNWTVQQTMDDPNSTRNAVALASMKWVNYPGVNMVNSTTTTGVQGNYAYAPAWARLLLNSGTGTATATFAQNFLR